ncbi:MAG TPA: transposase, partial [Polyangiaceae bacterium]
PPLSTERLLPGPDGLVRIALKKPFSDGTVAVDLDPLSLLCRLVALVPAPRFHTVRYSGVLAAASKWRPFIVPKPAPTGATDPASTSDQQSCGLPPECVDGSRYRPWAELLRRTFGIDVETCPRWGRRMRLLAVITDLAIAARLLRHRGEPTEPPTRAPARAPPFWQSKIVRRHGEHEQSAQLGLFDGTETARTRASEEWWPTRAAGRTFVRAARRPRPIAVSVAPNPRPTLTPQRRNGAEDRRRSDHSPIVSPRAATLAGYCQLCLRFPLSGVVSCRARAHDSGSDLRGSREISLVWIGLGLNPQTGGGDPLNSLQRVRGESPDV